MSVFKKSTGKSIYTRKLCAQLFWPLFYTVICETSSVLIAVLQCTKWLYQSNRQNGKQIVKRIKVLKGKSLKQVGDGWAELCQRIWGHWRECKQRQHSCRNGYAGGIVPPSKYYSHQHEIWEHLGQAPLGIFASLQCNLLNFFCASALVANSFPFILTRLIFILLFSFNT